MIANILIGGAIFGYAGWAMFRFIKKSKQGKCAACSAQKYCSSQTSCTTSKKNSKDMEQL